MLADGSAVAFKAVRGGVELELPPQKPGEWDRVIAVQQ